MHQPRVKNVFQVPLAHKDIVLKMPILGPKMHPGCFQAILLLEYCIGNSNWALSAELEKEAPIVIAVAIDVPINDSLPGL